MELIEERAVAEAASARFFRVLADPTRLAIVARLLSRPHTVSELMAELQLSQSRVSNHLACLRWCRFVASEREGRNVTYSVIDDRLAALLALAAELSSDNQDLLASCRKMAPPWT